MIYQRGGDDEVGESLKLPSLGDEALVDETIERQPRQHSNHQITAQGALQQLGQHGTHRMRILQQRRWLGWVLLKAEERGWETDETVSLHFIASSNSLFVVNIDLFVSATPSPFTPVLASLYPVPSMNLL